MNTVLVPFGELEDMTRPAPTLLGVIGVGWRRERELREQISRLEAQLDAAGRRAEAAEKRARIAEKRARIAERRVTGPKLLVIGRGPENGGFS